MSANDTQVAGSHYKSSIQHWDYVVANDLDYFQAQITKYVTRWKKKNGLTDLQKAQHFLAKYIEVSGNYLKPPAATWQVGIPGSVVQSDTTPAPTPQTIPKPDQLSSTHRTAAARPACVPRLRQLTTSLPPASFIRASHG